MKRSAIIIILSYRLLAQTVSADPLRQCSHNPACAELELEGACCPTQDFLFLDCCLGTNDNETETRISDQNPMDDSKLQYSRSLFVTPQCSRYTGCAHLAADCCPTRDGVMLDCCNTPMVVTTTPVPSVPPPGPAPTNPALTAPPVGAANSNDDSKQCSLYTGCKHLANDCCPTNSGVMLDCCNSPLVNGLTSPSVLPTTPTPTFSSPVTAVDIETEERKTFCSSHPQCPEYEIACCPTSITGTFLSCCEENDNIFLAPNDPAPSSPPPTRFPTPPPVNREISPGNPNKSGEVQWGPNVYQIDGSWSTVQIQNLVDSIHHKQVNNEMGNERYGIYFHPGVYGSASQPLMIQLGYYTEVAGLGKRPTDVVIYGKIEVYNRCFDPALFNDQGQFVPSDGSGHCIALNNFWRSLSNLSVHIISRNQDQCRSRANFWAVSQASSMRRVSFVNGDVSLMDYCTMPAFASGGFLADSKFSGEIENGSQQQWISRNINVQQNWSGSVWNQVFLGSQGVPSGFSFPDPPVSTLSETPISREKPFIYVENDEFHVFVPSAVTNTRGPSWDQSNNTPGESIPLDEFFVITPSTATGDIDHALGFGLHLLFTPGVYDVYKTIYISDAGTVVLGMGHATLTARNGVVPIKTSNAPGIILASITIDAGEAESPLLLQVGSKTDPSNSSPNNPITLSDLYIRVGGPYVGKTNVAIEINADNVLIDHAWIWRADHGIENFDMSDGYAGDNERWRTNTGRNGIIVNGDDVTAIGLFVEHFQEHNLIWNGEDGKVYMFQSELAYEPPFQSDWTTPDGTLGYAAYKVSSQVRRHYLLGGGVYCYNRNNPSIITEQGFEVPTASGVVLERIMTRNLSGPGVIKSIVNGLGTQVDTNNRGPYYILGYSSGSGASTISFSESNSAVHRYYEDYHDQTHETSDGSRSSSSQSLILSILASCSAILLSII